MTGKDKKSSVTIIGTGALGSVLSHALTEANYRIESVFNRTVNVASKIAQRIDADVFGKLPNKKHELGKIVFLTVPDRHISKVTNQLAALHYTFDEHLVIHCSGNISSNVLEPLQDKGAAVASFHPLQTFTAHSTPSDFKGIYIDIEGDDQAVEQLEILAQDIGSHPLIINIEAKRYLHAAAVMASNNLVGLIESATQIAEIGGMDKNEARRALMPLVRQTVTNIASSETIGQALSGPVARGDASTVAEHMKLLEQNPQLKVLYQQLGTILAEIARKEGRINPEQHDEIITLFKNIES